MQSSLQSFSDIFRPDYVKVIDPILNVKPRKHFAVLKGGLETTERQLATSSASQSSVTFNTPPPNPTTFVSRRFLLKVPVTITFNDGALTVPWSDFLWGVRQMPLHTIMQSIDITLNGQSISLNMQEVIKPLLMYHGDGRNLKDREFSMSPCQPDIGQRFLETFTNRSSSYSDAPFAPRLSSNGLSRCAFTKTVATAQPGTATIEYEFVEEICLSPLLFGGVRDEGFVGLQKIEINITWASQLPNLLVTQGYGNNNVVPANVAIGVTLGQTPNLLFRYVTPPMSLVLPPFIQYNYNSINYYKTSFNCGTAIDSTASAVSNNIQLNAIPRFIYIFAREASNVWQVDPQAKQYTDCYYGIEGISINWNNSNALLSNATKQQLYDISRKNGCCMNYPEWAALDMSANGLTPNGQTTRVSEYRGRGSILCLEMGTDIGLAEDEAAGLIGTYNLQINVDLIKANGWIPNPPTSPQLYIITITPGIFTIYQNTASKRIGVISRADIITAQPRTGFNYDSLEQSLMSGGFKFKNFAKKWGPKVLKSALKFGKKNLTGKSGKIATGIHDAMYGDGMVMGGRRRRRRRKRRKGSRKKSRKRRRRSKKKGGMVMGGKKRRKRRRKGSRKKSRSRSRSRKRRRRSKKRSIKW